MKRTLGEKVLNVSMAILIGAVGFSIWHQSELNKDQAERDRVYSCHARNAFKELDLQRWLYVLEVAKPDKSLPKAEYKRVKMQNAKFKAYVVAADKQEDCSKPRDSFTRPDVRLP